MNSLVVLGYGELEGLKVMAEGINELAKGNLVDGTAALFVGLAKFQVEAPFDTFFAEVIEVTSALQAALFLEPVGRFLTDDEKAYLTWVFYGGDWWINLIRVKEGFSGVWSLDPRPFTVETTIYLKDWPAHENLTAAGRRALMVHETTHAWQFIHGGGDYKLESLYYRAKDSNALYHWEPAVNNDRSWGSLNPEQQARFVEV